MICTVLTYLQSTSNIASGYGRSYLCKLSYNPDPRERNWSKKDINKRRRYYRHIICIIINLHPVYQQKRKLRHQKRLISSYIYPLSVIAQYHLMSIYQQMMMYWIFVDTVMDYCILHSESAAMKRKLYAKMRMMML